MLNPPELGPHGLVLLIATLAVFVLLIWDRWPIATVCLGVLTALPLGFSLWPLLVAGERVDPMRFLGGFGHPALVAICALMVVGHGIAVTGALEPLARRVGAWVAQRPRWAMLGVLVGAAAASGVVNDTPVVVLLIPLLLAAARRAGAQAGEFLMPMNFAVLMGGMATTIGTSTNLIVVALAASLGVAPLGMFSFMPLVALAAVPGLLYLWWVAPRMLRGVKPPTEAFSTDVFEAEIHIEPGDWLEGRQFLDMMVATEHRLRPLALLRGRLELAMLPTRLLRAGDRIRLCDTAQNLKEFEAVLKGRLHRVRSDAGDDAEGADEQAAPRAAVVAQLVITAESPLVGQSVRAQRMAERHGVVAVGLRPRERSTGWQHAELNARTLAPGDILLLQGAPDAVQEVQRDGLGLLLDQRFALPRAEKAPLALGVLAAIVVLAATKVLPIALAALGGALVLVVGRCLAWKDVSASLSSKVILLVAASLALGDALQVTGATPWLAAHLALLLHGMSPAWVATLLMGLMGVLTNFVSNNAAAAIGTPLAVALAQSLGVEAEPLVLAVLFGCNLCYVTPMGYQTNLLVMSAAGYRFADFVRVGGPLFLIMWGALSLLLRWRYGL